MHADQIAAVEAVREKAGSKGVEVIPEWLCPPRTPDGDWSGHRVEDLDTAVMWRICPTTVPLIITGALAKWLAGQGIAVVSSYGTVEWVAYRSWTRQWMDLKSTDHLSALLEATLARLDELPAPSDPPPASKEGE